MPRGAQGNASLRKRNTNPRKKYSYSRPSGISGFLLQLRKVGSTLRHVRNATTAAFSHPSYPKALVGLSTLSLQSSCGLGAACSVAVERGRLLAAEGDLS